MKYRETIRRALRTFLQAMFGYIVTNVATLIPVWTDGGDGDYLLRVCIGFVASALAAGLAAIMNLPAKDTDEEAMG